MSTAPTSAVSNPDGVPPPTLADQVEAAVRSVNGVAGLHAGAFGEVATYLPGRRVTGIAVRPDGCEVHVVLSWGSQAHQIAARIRAAIAPILSTAVHVAIEDVAEPEPAAHTSRRLL